MIENSKVFDPGMVRCGAAVAGQGSSRHGRIGATPLGGLADWKATIALLNVLNDPMNVDQSSDIVDESARLNPSSSDLSYAKRTQLGSWLWSCEAATLTPIAAGDGVLAQNAAD